MHDNRVERPIAEAELRGFRVALVRAWRILFLTSGLVSLVALVVVGRSPAIGIALILGVLVGFILQSRRLRPLSDELVLGTVVEITATRGEDIDNDTRIIIGGERLSWMNDTFHPDVPQKRTGPDASCLMPPGTVVIAVYLPRSKQLVCRPVPCAEVAQT